MEHLIKNAQHLSLESKRTAINALQAASDHEAAQHGLARLLSIPEFTEMAAISSHLDYHKYESSLVRALEKTALSDQGPSEKITPERCTSLLALGAAVGAPGNMRNAAEQKQVVNRLAKAAFHKTANTCYIRALGNAGESAGEHAGALMKAASDTSLSDGRRAEMMGALKDVPGRSVDQFLANRFKAGNDPGV